MSAVSWGASFPTAWPRTRVKYVCRFAGGGTPDKGKSEYWNGAIPWVSPKDMQGGFIEDTEDHITVEGLESSAAKLIEPGAVLVVVRSGILRHSIPVSINQVTVALNQDMRALIPNGQLEARYLARLIEGHQRELLNAWSKVGSTVESIEFDLLGGTEIAVPPLAQQGAIADFLDRETARIDALIAAKERLLRLLAETRRALITRIVTRGLDPDASIRESDNPWLGAIPAHWVLTRLKFVASVQTGIALGKDFGGKELHDYPYLRVANVQDGFIDLTDVKTIAVPEREADLCRLRAGDVLMNEGGDADKLGRGAIWTGEIDPCLHQNHVFAVRPRTITSEWLASWTSCDVAKAYFESRAKQSTNLASISATNLMELPLLCPPLEEQLAIVEHIGHKNRKLDAIQSATERTVGLLKERRATLIAAAVTGQIDVEATA